MPVNATSSVLAGPPQQRRTPQMWSSPGALETLASHQVRTGMRRVLGKFVDLKSLDGILELSWHTDQLHRIGAGLNTRPQSRSHRHHARDAPPQRHRVIRAQAWSLT